VPSTNTTAILAFVFVWFFCPVSIVLGHVALRQIRQTGEGGAPLAKAALILGYVFTALAVLLVCVAAIGALIALSGSAE
jgi:lipopolysaccharide export LptBFGC system permease protein LptF